jgi:hypothetical protein
MADALGGHRRGSEAARLAVDTVLRAFSDAPACHPDSVRSWLEAADAAISEQQRGLGTCGRDSRLYYFQTGRLTAQTSDHSVPQALADSGEIRREEIRFHEDRARLLHSLGAGQPLRPSVPDAAQWFAEGDAFLLCTDGFWEYVDEARMERDLRDASDAGDWLERLLRRVVEMARPITTTTPPLRFSCAREARKPGYSGLLPFLPKLTRGTAILACLLAPVHLLPAPQAARVTLTFPLTTAQEADLDRLLDAQQDPDSPEFHRWLTPEEFGERFGPAPEQLENVAAWLRAEGLTVEETARGRRWIVASGAADQVDRTRRRVPSHLAAVVPTVRWTPPRLQPRQTVDDGSHALAPADLAAIYGVAGDGAGQTIGILGQSNFYLSDVAEFRSRFGLPERTPRVILVGAEPGFDPNGGMLEALVDLEWSGAVAPMADLVYVYARDIVDALRAAVDRNVAPVLNFSFGVCEANVPPPVIESIQALVRQANAQGITFVAGSGDNGAAACNYFGNVATLGLNVMFPASLPEATAVGGTLLNEGTGSYWSNGVATGYIPEIAWNDTPRRPVFTATGGGASMLYPKPRWQTGFGVPPENARHVPDVAFAASPVHNPYIAIAGNAIVLLGGTSVTAPVFAGVMAVVNQRVGRMGNINSMLYANHDEGSPAPWFHDIVEGDNIVQCFPGTRDCVDGLFGYRAGPGYDPVTGLGSIDIPVFVNGVAARIGKRQIRRPPLR